jgi:hypothetical protein
VSDDPLERLLASVQGALADILKARDYRQKRALARAAKVQAECAKAVALNNLATEVGRLVDAITKE